MALQFLSLEARIKLKRKRRLKANLPKIRMHGIDDEVPFPGDDAGGYGENGIASFSNPNLAEFLGFLDWDVALPSGRQHVFFPSQDGERIWNLYLCQHVIFR
jgi:hypothetical protein